MSDEEEIISILSDPDLMREYGFQITPKGCMGLLFMAELGMDHDTAGALATKLDNAIFNAGYIYVRPEGLSEVPDEFE